MNLIKTGLVVAAAAGVLAASGCTIADPDTSQLVLHYSGGAFSSQNFEYCTAPGVRSTGGPGDFDFYYPAGQRTFAFRSNPDGSVAPGADAPALKVSTKNQIELTVQGAITLTLNPDCTPYTDATGRAWPGGKLQKFHDTIGRQHLAYAEDGGNPQPPGWDTVLSLYVGGPAERAMNNAGLSFDWQNLCFDTASKNAWTAAVETLLRGTSDAPGLIAQQAGDDLFLINNIQLDKPDVPASLRAELDNNQAAQLRKQTADTDQAAANSFPGGLPAYQAYQQQQAINKAIQEGRVNPLIVPQGSPVIVSPGH